MKAGDFEKDISSGSFKPLYLLHGQDVISKDRLVRKVMEAVPEGMRDFNLQVLMADDSPAPEVVEQARTMPFMSPPRVVVVRGVDRYAADDLKAFNSYIADPNDTTCLVLVADKPDFRLKFFKTVKELKLDVSFDTPKGRELIEWVKDAVELKGQSISDEAVKTIIDQVGPELMELDRELEKVSLYALDKAGITPADVRAAARVGATANIFMLGDAVGEQNSGKALGALKELLDRDHHLPILIMLVRHFRLMLKAKIMVINRIPGGEAAKELGVPPFAAKKYMSQANGLTLYEIKKGLACLLTTNLTLISSPAPARHVMDKLILDLTTLKQRRRPEL